VPVLVASLFLYLLIQVLSEVKNLVPGESKTRIGFGRILIGLNL
jgi:hypothetical protein